MLLLLLVCEKAIFNLSFMYVTLAFVPVETNYNMVSVFFLGRVQPPTLTGQSVTHWLSSGIYFSALNFEYASNE